MTRFIANIKRFVKQNNSTILSVMGSGGVIVTTILAIRATPKACELIKADSRFNHDGDPYAYTKLEAIQSAWKCYIPTAVVGLSTIACIFGANALNKRQQAAITSAYMLLDNTYKQYKDFVRVDNQLVKYRDLGKFIKTAYNTPIIRQPAVALVSDPTTKYNYIEVAVDAYTTLGNVTLTYYRKPLRFNTTDGASKCERPESIHSEIVDLAVNMFITEGKYRLQVKQPNNQQ